MLLYLSKSHVTDKKENVLSAPPIKPVLVLRLPKGLGVPCSKPEAQPQGGTVPATFPQWRTRPCAAGRLRKGSWA